MWAPEEEEPEIQVFKSTRVPEEKRHSHGRPSSSLTQHRRRDMPVFVDTFTKRLGPISSFQERTYDRSNAFSTTSTSHKQRRNPSDDTTKPPRDHEVVKVDKKGCRWPCNSEAVSVLPHETDNPKTPRASSIRQQASARSVNGKESKGLVALLNRKLFRQNNNAVMYPAWEAEWTMFREQHDQEMKQMKDMYLGLQEICEELKRMGSHREDVSGTSSRRVSVSESCDSRMDGAPLLGHSNRHGGLNYGHSFRENGHHQPNRRAKSAPKTRVNWDTGLTKENGMHIRVPANTNWFCPTAALFEEIVQVERHYLHNFVKTLVKFGENLQLSEDSDSEHRTESLSDLVARLVPHATFAKPWHVMYGIEAWLNRLVFKEFRGASLGLQEGGVQDARERRISSWDEYQRLSLISPLAAIDPESKIYNRGFHVFCNQKFQAIHDELQWWDDWPDEFVEDFLEAMKHVWRAYKLSLAFDPPVSLFMKSSTAFDLKYMEPLESLAALQNDASLSYPQVGFVVNPGFRVLNRLIKSQVYLSPKGS